ncbi:hypothetical protein BURMUCGD2M_6319 [Burkholderia multivorans CGD2M]|uniref:Uncharacterized protein n=1 Tax=Burkholderia multivorans CGD2 TaxID=513052 RepID=B9BNR2_9BURK|nr:hypothetical protein BURMUCGD2_6332 [Burkholderia multivorans CGD2]EEE13599.1 hypothetical protein BURMUCGD2M_6319 [Burkholderia multivorans CGD2M]EJO51341.1 hypothetical protein BURMUCF2_B0254 [Burkholderia multivorans CF2]
MRARRRPGLLTDLAEIEWQVALSGDRLTARETEVCAIVAATVVPLIPRSA